jgi:ABC-type amino acid transport substrate-binding protein
VNSLDEAKTVKSIAAVKDEAGQQKLAELGFINFAFTNSTADGLKKLMAGEADLWLGTRADVELVAKKAGVDAAQLEPAVFVHKVDLYIAFNKNMPFATVDQWQKALDSLKK